MKKLIVANWKMNPQTAKEARSFFNATLKVGRKIRQVKIIICPPFVYLDLFSKKTKISLGAQDVFWEDSGFYTGAVSAKMLKNLGVQYVIVGHSERRRMGETDEMINKKIRQALKNNLKVIFCVGELERDEENNYFQFIKDQIIKGVEKISVKFLKNLIVTYEPVWAISSAGRLNKAEYHPDTPEDIQEMVMYVRRVLVSIFGKSARNIPVLYGGSVDAKSVHNLLERGGIDGLLVGRASWSTKTFGELLKNI